MTTVKMSHSHRSRKTRLLILSAIVFGLGALLNGAIARFANAKYALNEFEITKKQELELREKMRQLDLKMGAECNNPDFFKEGTKLRDEKIQYCTSISRQMSDINRQTNSRDIARLGAVWINRVDNFASSSNAEFHDYFLRRSGLRFYFPDFDPNRYLRSADPDGKQYDTFLNEALQFARRKAQFAYSDQTELQIPRSRATETPTPAKQP